MKEKDLLFSVLTKALVKTEEELAQIIYDGSGEVKPDAADIILSNDAERVRRIKKDADGLGFNNGHKKGLAEALTDIESKFKSKFNYNSDSKGLDLIEEFVSKQQKTTVNIDDVRKHPAYLDLERNSVTKNEYNKVLNEFEDYKTNLAKKEVMSKVHAKAIEFFDKSGAVIEDNPTVSANRKKYYLSEFEKYDYEWDGDYPVPVKDGVRVQDDHGNTLTFEKLARQAVESNFVVQQQQYRQSSQNSNGAGMSVPVPRSASEYTKMLKDAEGDTKKRVLIMEAWKAAQKK